MSDSLLVSGTSQMIHTDIVIANTFRTAPIAFSRCGSVAQRISLLGNSLSSLSLSNTVFRNVSNFYASPTIHDDVSMQITQVSGCKSESIENGLYGTIFGNVNGPGTFLGMNVTILNNAATYTTSYVNKTGQKFIHPEHHSNLCTLKTQVFHTYRDTTPAPPPFECQIASSSDVMLLMWAAASTSATI
ncbi:hypothetical protein BLNAU_3119 [Blattamonas nauphoetae]|uniref:Uncharacterized protein n=1 Tax=Blattamonas nauphoetae TaxID=2049346 RepID=A0ABQ9YEF0_9EUKA|nr:hypothetical protein BLNAU_3119 [Blattamonas nauphoetae]